MQKSIRANQVPSGGGAVQPNGQGAGNNAKLDIVSSMALREAFMEASEYNEVSQGVSPMLQGQQTTIQIRNVGFVQKTELRFQAKFNLSSGATATLSDDFPYCLVPQITSQLNGATVLHSGTSAELAAIYDKKYNGDYDYKDKTSVGRTPITATLPTRHSLDIYDVNTSKHTIYTESGNVTYSIDKLGGNPLNVISLTASAASVVVVEFSVCIEYTMSKSNLVGILPLQNNSIYHEIKAMFVNALTGSNSEPFTGLSGGTITLNVASVEPINSFWAVPFPNNPNLYAYYISFNYICQSQMQTTTGAGANGFNFNMKNNSYFMSALFTFRDSSTLKLIPPTQAISRMYMDYNGTAQVMNIPIMREFYALRRSLNGKLPTKFGEYLKTFSSPDRDINGDNWSKFIDLYEANSPRFVGDTIAANMMVNIMQEYLAPVTTQQIM